MLKIIFASLLVCVASAQAEDGVTATEIKLGTSINLTGPNNESIHDLVAGSNTYFNKINAAGGVNGRKIKVVIMDDKADPRLTVENSNSLIEKEKVFALFNYYGSQNVKVALTVVEKNDIPFVFPTVGSTFIREKPIKNAFVLRGGHRDSGAYLTRYAIETLKTDNIGAFYQDDEVGNSGMEGLREVLSEKKIERVKTAKYNRDGTGIEAALKELKSANVKAVILFSLKEPARNLIKLAEKEGFHPYWLGIFPSYSKELIEALGPRAGNSYFMQFHPALDDVSYPFIKDFQADMKAANAKITPVSFEGYAGAALTVQALKAAGKEPTRDSFRAALEKTENFELYGTKIHLSPASHQALKQFFMTQGSKEGLKYLK